MFITNRIRLGTVGSSKTFFVSHAIAIFITF